MIVVTTLTGFALVEEDDTLYGLMPFPRNPEKVSEILFSLRRGDLPAVTGSLPKEKIKAVDVPGLASALSAKLIGIEERNQIRKKINEEILKKSGTNKREFAMFARDVALYLTEKEIRISVSSKDLFASQAINTIDEIDQTINLFSERLKEWYGLHFPELEKLYNDNNAYCLKILEKGLRENFDNPDIKKTAATSIGALISERDINAIQALASNISSLYNTKQSLVEYVENGISQVAPNLTALLGPLLAARLIALVGGLKNLSTKPASTIQMLGAEKALFRHLKSSAKPPKHGIIFQHPAVHNAPYWQRGKIARSLAAELAIASRLDYLSGKYMGEELLDKFEKRIAEVKKKYPKPPKKKRRGKP
ncbi:MAG: NOP5/NOP56 family protein [Candidatus Methanofastidiosia archaeon]